MIECHAPFTLVDPITKKTTTLHFHLGDFFIYVIHAKNYKSLRCIDESY